MCTLNLKNFLGLKPPDPQSGEGLRRPFPDPRRAFCPTTSHYRVGGAFFDGWSWTGVRTFHDRLIGRVVEWMRTGLVMAAGHPVTFKARLQSVRVVTRLRTTAWDSESVHVVWSVCIFHGSPGRVRVDGVV